MCVRVIVDCRKGGEMCLKEGEESRPIYIAPSNQYKIYMSFKEVFRFYDSVLLALAKSI